MNTLEMLNSPICEGCGSDKKIGELICLDCDLSNIDFNLEKNHDKESNENFTYDNDGLNDFFLADVT